VNRVAAEVVDEGEDAGHEGAGVAEDGAISGPEEGPVDDAVRESIEIVAQARVDDAEAVAQEVADMGNNVTYAEDVVEDVEDVEEKVEILIMELTFHMVEKKQTGSRAGSYLGNCRG
jgi:hypothetical protein